VLKAKLASLRERDMGDGESQAQQAASDVAIRVESLSKCYQLYDRPEDRLKQAIYPRLRRLMGMEPKSYARDFWALRDVSFEVKKGETVGIIGRNGSGKSTLLQMICGTLNPTSGTIQTSGRVAALLELGAGFNPEFTGRENVYMNGAIFGLSKEEIDARFDNIAAFADIGQFIDHPVKTYSSGMYVRLAFAVIAHVDADILVVDEALAVGDAFFQQKCMRFLHAFQDKRGTVLFASHDTGSVLSLCDKAVLLMPNASAIHLGDAETICKLYLERLYADPVRQIEFGASMAAVGGSNSEKIAAPADAGQRRRSYDGDMVVETVYAVSAFRSEAESFGNGGATIIDAGFLGKDDHVESTVKGDQPVRFFIRVLVRTRIQWPAFGFMIKNGLGEYVYAEGTDMHFSRHKIELDEGDVATAIFAFTMPHLIRGRYLVNVAFAEGPGDDHIQHCWMHDAIQIDVISGRLVHGYSGMSDMVMSIRVNW
jgi:lipopolysaccharide transport system ATP-binding protein